jgi:dihydropyrimidine dehydrogenase (NAD+) subunit PreA
MLPFFGKREMADLRCSLAGIRSPNPFWLASGPPSNTGAQVVRAFEAGWGGAVWKTLCLEPTVNTAPRLAAVRGTGNELAGLVNIELIMDRPLEDNLREMAEVKRLFPERAVVASVMAGPRKEWAELVRRVEETGADGFELNFGCPHGLCERGMGSAVGQEPKAVAKIMAWVRGMTKRPVIVKLTPNVTDITAPAAAAAKAGADAISLINTVRTIPGVDLEALAPLPVVAGKGTPGGMCGPAVKPIALRMTADLAKDPGVGLSISGIGGVSTWQDAAEYLLLGASCVQVCAAVMLKGYGIVAELRQGLAAYMDRKGFATLDDLRGRALPQTTAWGELEAPRKVAAAINPVTCNRCGLCVVSCRDGGHQAIESPGVNLDNFAIGPSVDPGEKPAPVVDEKKCVGCGLCAIVCPVAGCITWNAAER